MTDKTGVNMRDWKIALVVALIPICFFVLLLCVGFATAATDTVVVSDTFKLNEKINYAKPCFNNGTYCSASATCNMTFFTPKNIAFVDNVIAENHASYFNYTINTPEIGIYKVDMICNDNGLTGSESFYFEVTPSGNNTSLGFFIVLLIVSAGLIVFGFSIKEGWLVIFGGMLLIIVGVYSINEGIAGVKNMFTTWATGITLIGVGAYLSIMSGLELMEE